MPKTKPKTKTTTVEAPAPPAGPLTKTQLCAEIDATAGLERGTARDVLSALAAVVGRELDRVGKVAIPGIGIVVAVHKPEVAAGPRFNPFTKELKDAPARPASVKVKVRPAQSLATGVAPKA